MADQGAALLYSSPCCHIRIPGTQYAFLDGPPPLLARVRDWRVLLEYGIEAAIRGHEPTGRSLGSAAFVTGLDARLGRRLSPRRPGRKPKATAVSDQK